MLYLEPPFHIIEGISVFRDHEDSQQYYFMPLYPHLTVKLDEETGLEMPQIQLIKYRGEAGSGGFLNFDVNLGIEDDLLASIRTSIKSLDDLDDEPRLAPIPLVDGTVKLMMLGKQSDSPDSSEETPENPPVGEVEGPEFVVSIEHHAKPALYASNQAAFSVKLDEAGVAVVEKSIQGEMAPIGVVYSLDYLGLRNAYKVSVSVDWSRVQHHLEESFSVNTPVYSSSVDTIVDELIEDRVIDMQVDKLFVSDDSTATMEARMDQAVNQIKDMVLDNFFEPSLEPIPPQGDDTIEDVGRVALMIASGGFSEKKLFSYKKIDITRIDKKKLDVNMSERTAVIRSIYPQGHLEGLFSILREEGVELSRFVIPVELDHPWFKKRTVNVIARSNFEADKIESLNIILNYGGDKKNIILDKSKPEDKVQWLSKLEDGKMLMPVEISYTVHFQDVDNMERPSKLSSPKLTMEVENFEVRPHDLFGWTPIPIMALDFPWKSYSSIEVSTRYTDEENEINIDDFFFLNEGAQETLWNLFSLNPQKNTFSYKLLFRSTDHRDLEMPWVETDEEKIPIRDPFPEKRKITFVPAVNWTEVKNVFVDVTYEDEVNDVREQQSISFSETDNAPKEIVIKHFQNPKHRILKYKVILLTSEGSVLEIPTCQTLSDRIFITPQMRGHKIVAIDPSNISFKSKKIREVELQLKFEDKEAGLSFNDSFTFTSAEDRVRYFEYDFVDASSSGFEYTISKFFENGMKLTSDWQKSNEEILAPTGN